MKFFAENNEPLTKEDLEHEVYGSAKVLTITLLVVAIAVVVILLVCITRLNWVDGLALWVMCSLLVAVLLIFRRDK